MYNGHDYVLQLRLCTPDCFSSLSSQIMVCLLHRTCRYKSRPLFSLQVTLFTPGHSVYSRSFCLLQISLFTPDLSVHSISFCLLQISLFTPDLSVHSRSLCYLQIILFAPDLSVHSRSLSSPPTLFGPFLPAPAQVLIRMLIRTPIAGTDEVIAEANTHTHAHTLIPTHTHAPGRHTALPRRSPLHQPLCQ